MKNNAKGFKFRKVFVVNAFTIFLFIASGMTCFAAVGETAIYIYPNQVWTSSSENLDSRSGNYSTVYARNHAVRPTSGSDTFSKIQCKVSNGYGTTISGTYTLDESSSSNTSLTIREGYLNLRTVCFQFRGNSSKEAYATVSYDGR